MSTSWATFLFETANFLLLAAALGWFFFRPVRAAIERRHAELEEQRHAAAETRDKAEAALAEMRERQSAFHASLDKLRKDAQRDAQQQREQLLDQTREQLRHEREQLEQELAGLRRTQVHELITDAAGAAREIVVRLLAEIGGPELEERLLERAALELGSLRDRGSLAPLMVESVRRLDANELDRLGDAAAVPATQVRQRLEPSLTAGIRVLTARGLVDVSAAGLAAAAERALIARMGAGDESAQEGSATGGGPG